MTEQGKGPKDPTNKMRKALTAISDGLCDMVGLERPNPISSALLQLSLNRYFRAASDAEREKRLEIVIDGLAQNKLGQLADKNPLLSEAFAPKAAPLKPHGMRLVGSDKTMLPDLNKEEQTAADALGAQIDRWAETINRAKVREFLDARNPNTPRAP